MYCPSCGQQIADGSKFCTLCGSKLIQGPQQNDAPAPEQPAAPSGYDPQNYSYGQQPQQPQQGGYSYGQPQQPQQGGYSYGQPQQPGNGQGKMQYRAGADPKYGGFPMKWHKFLVYFALWLSAVVNVVSAISAFRGGQYGDQKDLVYAVFGGGLKAVDVIYGVLLLALAVLAVLAALKLMKLKAGAPLLLYILYGANVVVSVVYMLLASIVTKLPIGDFFTSSTISSLVVGIVFLTINVRYYTKRASLFVN